MRVIENCSSSDGEVIFTLGAVELLVSFDPRNTLTVATRAFYPVRPAQLGQNFPAPIIRIEQPLNIEESHG